MRKNNYRAPVGSRSRRPRRRRRASPPRRSPRACSRRRARCVGRERCPSRPQKSCLGSQCKHTRDHGHVGVHATGAAGAAEWGEDHARRAAAERRNPCTMGPHACQQASAARGRATASPRPVSSSSSSSSSPRASVVRRAASPVPQRGATHRPKARPRPRREDWREGPRSAARRPRLDSTDTRKRV